MTAQQIKLQKGFTLIELLVVIGILAILLAITLIAINPARQFGQANDTARRSAATQILNAIGQYTASNGGILPAEVLNGNYGVGNTTPLVLNSTNFPLLCAQLVSNYLPALPVDPSGNDQNGIEAADCAAGTATPSVPWNTQYSILKDANNRITVSAPGAYAGPIQVTR
jgi:prepilin-type N-terminal cleavage/methylation domain-containing protein